MSHNRLKKQTVFVRCLSYSTTGHMNNFYKLGEIVHHVGTNDLVVTKHHLKL